MVGDTIRTARERANLSMSEVVDAMAAAGVDVKQPYISMIETGKRSPSFEVARALLDAVGATPSERRVVIGHVLSMEPAELPRVAGLTT